MHLVFNLISIISINLLIINRSNALSFTNNLNPFYRNQLTSIENASIISNIDTNLRSNVQHSTQEQSNSNLDSDNRYKWPNIRFMRTFLRSAPSNPGNNQLNPASPKYILGYNPTNEQAIKQRTKLPEQHKASNDENESQNLGLIDWNKILTKLNQATGFRNASNETIRVTKRPTERSSEFYSSNDKKEEEEKESNNGLINYFTTFFSSNENETINAEKEKQSAKQKLTTIESKPISVDLFYFNDNLLAKKQIEVLVCDKTMAIINVRKNRFDTNRTVQNCVLFDLEKRGKVSV